MIRTPTSWIYKVLETINCRVQLSVLNYLQEKSKTKQFTKRQTVS